MAPTRSPSTDNTIRLPWDLSCEERKKRTSADAGRSSLYSKPRYNPTTDRSPILTERHRSEDHWFWFPEASVQKGAPIPAHLAGDHEIYFHWVAIDAAPSPNQHPRR